MKKILLCSLSVLVLTGAICDSVFANQDSTSAKPGSKALCKGETCVYERSSNDSLEKMVYETATKDPKFLSWLVARGHAALIKTLLEHGFKPSKENLVHLAAINNRVDVLKVLKDAAFDIDLKDEDDLKPIHKAAQHGAVEAMQWLIANGVDIDTLVREGLERVSPVYLAAENHEWDTVRWLLENGASPYVIKDGYSLLDLAVRNDRPDIVELALKKGAIWSNDTLEIAVYQNIVPIAKILLSHEANSSITPGGLNTAFSDAVHHGNLEMAALLLDHGANVDTIDASGFTSLYWAIFNDQTEMVELLIKHNANVNLATVYSAPLSHAKSRGNEAIIDLLKKHGAVEVPWGKKSSGDRKPQN